LSGFIPIDDYSCCRKGFLEDRLYFSDRPASALRYHARTIASPPTSD
jgi:hypothetical protein